VGFLASCELFYTSRLLVERTTSYTEHIKQEGFFYYVLYSTLLYLPPLRFHCVGGWWDRTQDSCDFGFGCQDALATRLHLILKATSSSAENIFEVSHQCELQVSLQITLK
jgi:hypothetical protein